MSGAIIFTTAISVVLFTSTSTSSSDIVYTSRTSLVKRSSYAVSSFLLSLLISLPQSPFFSAPSPLTISSSIPFLSSFFILSSGSSAFPSVGFFASSRRSTFAAASFFVLSFSWRCPRIVRYGI